VGCCAHVATIVWFLGRGRHDGYKPPRALKRHWAKVMDAARAGDYVDLDEEVSKEND
jgi:hypothetical protein